MADIVHMPKLGFDMAEGTLVRWVRHEGEPVKKGEVLAEIETDKATVEVESSYSGLVHKHLVEQGAIVPVGAPIAVIAAPGEKVEDAAATPAPAVEKVAPALSTAAPAAAAAPVVLPPAVQEAASGPLKASPLARKIASESGVDLRVVQGSGPGGRIVRKDVEAALTQPAPVATAIPAPLAAWVPATAAPTDERVPLDKLRQAIGRRLVEAKQQVPHFYITHDYDAAPVMALRKQLNDLLPEEQKLSVNDFIVKAAALALRRFPNLNASLGANEIIRHGQVNVGVAVAVPGGLLTVVSRDTDQKPMRQLSIEIKELVTRARSGKVRPDDIEGSTFSISNLGMFDVENFAAIINPPEVAILAVGSVRQAPVVVDGEVKVGTRLKMTLSADHRVTDGAEAAQFMQALADALEKPLQLML